MATKAPRPESVALLEKLVAALARRGLVTEAEIAARQAATERASPETGARMVARAWTDPAYRDLLLTDVIMPHLNGPDLAKQVQLLHPDVRVIFLSGYADSAVLQRGLDQSQTIFIPKPFRPETITRVLREVLDRPQGQTA